MKCPICLTEMQDGRCPSCGYEESTIPKPEFCQEETGFGAAEGCFNQTQNQDGHYAGGFVGKGVKSPKKRGKGLVLALLVVAAVSVVFSLVWLAVFRQPGGQKITLQPNLPAQSNAGEQAQQPIVPAIGELESLKGQTLQPVSWEKQVLYEADGLRVEFLCCSYDTEGYSFGECGRFTVGLYLSGTGDKYYELCIDQLTVNGVAALGEVYATVYPGDAFYVELEGDAEQLLRAGVTCPEELTMQLYVYPNSDSGPSGSNVHEELTVQASQLQGVQAPAPDGAIVWQNSDGITLRYLGGQIRESYDEMPEPIFWFWLENDSDQTVQLEMEEIGLAGEWESYPYTLTQMIAPDSCGLVAVQASSYSMSLSGESLSDLDELAVTFNLWDTYYGYIAQSQQFAVDLSAQAGTM